MPTRQRIVMLTSLIFGILCGSVLFARTNPIVITQKMGPLMVIYALAHAQNGDVIQVEPGIYTFSSSLYVKTGVTLVGEGAKLTMGAQPDFAFVSTTKDNSAIIIAPGGTVDNFNILMNAAPVKPTKFKGGAKKGSRAVWNCQGVLQYCNITGGNVTSLGSGETPADSIGGGVLNSGGTVQYCNVLHCQSKYGAGIFNTSGRVLDCNVSYCKADIYGGGILSQGGEVIYDTSNSASKNNTYDIKICNAKNGGGIVINNNGLLEIERDTTVNVTWNLASAYFSGGVNAKYIAGNGGGIYNNAYCTINVMGTLDVSYNRAKLQGGGIYNNGTVTTEDGNGTLNIHNNGAGHLYGTIFKAVRTGGQGGGVYNAGTILGATITSNLALENHNSFGLGKLCGSGGGIYNCGVVKDCTFSQGPSTYNFAQSGAYYTNAMYYCFGATVSGCKFNLDEPVSYKDSIQGKASAEKNVKYNNNNKNVNLDVLKPYDPSVPLQLENLNSRNL